MPQHTANHLKHLAEIAAKAAAIAKLASVGTEPTYATPVSLVGAGRTYVRVGPGGAG
jgi:hypothetical protein